MTTFLHMKNTTKQYLKKDDSLAYIYEVHINKLNLKKDDCRMWRTHNQLKKADSFAQHTKNTKPNYAVSEK